MSPRSLILDAQFDVERMLDTLAEMAESEREHNRVFNARIAHLNRMRSQVNDALRELKRIEDDPARHWQPEAVTS